MNLKETWSPYDYLKIVKEERTLKLTVRVPMSYIVKQVNQTCWKRKKSIRSVTAVHRIYLSVCPSIHCSRVLWGFSWGKQTQFTCLLVGVFLKSSLCRFDLTQEAPWCRGVSRSSRTLGAGRPTQEALMVPNLGGKISIYTSNISVQNLGGT